MLMKSKASRLALVVGSLLLLSACTRSVSHVDSEGKTDAPVFPDAKHAVRTEGSFVNVDNLRQVRPDMTKAQIYELLGTPHFNEGVFRVKEWDYIFHFTKADKSILTCQFKVLYNSDMKAQSFYFAPENCLSQLEEPKPVAKEKMHRVIGAEALFAFGSAELSREGVSKINTLAADLKTEKLDTSPIMIVGHTDRIGSASENDRLSFARADAVKRLLVADGISSGLIQAEGRGSREPVAFCDGTKSPALIACLAPNRRITVDIVNQDVR